MLSENEKIERLIKSLTELEGAEFIRNGNVHTPEEAVDHMKTKWKWEETEIKTAEDFIKIVGSKSSTTGKPYIIRLSDGTEIHSGDWFSKELKKIKKSSNQTVD